MGQGPHLTDERVLHAALDLLRDPRVHHLNPTESADALKAHLMRDPRTAAQLMAIRDQDTLNRRLSAFMTAARTIPEDPC
ncbi:hypothetical protein [Deinococcus kurensis]|uniref:hypothetical protein n=1 Tax=Deinococcus kurensis TaxID=2662757 RepID=UPI0012D2FC29|nr:hypothetical protein [Deinococcus kurensis]